jgi:hypothetical protein
LEARSAQCQDPRSGHLGRGDAQFFFVTLYDPKYDPNLKISGILEPDIDKVVMEKLHPKATNWP